MSGDEDVYTQSIEYTRTTVPSTMRSRYWRYFGFPSDDGNNILTRRKIICTLCNTVIAYNKNTSNMRTHLVAKHPKVLLQLQEPSMGNNEESDTPTGSTTFDVGYGMCRKRTHDNTHASSIVTGGIPSVADADRLSSHHVGSYFDTNAQAAPGDDPYINQSIVYERNSGVNITEQSKSDGRTAAYADVSVDHPETSTGNVKVEYIPVASKSSPPALPKHHKNPSNRQITEIIAEMLVSDLLPVSVVCGRGFQQVCCADARIDKKDLESKICSMQNDLQAAILPFLESTSKTSVYSLSCEFYMNIECQTVVNIYFNYINTENDDLECILYGTASMPDLNWAKLFRDLEIGNCAAIITNKPNEELSEFAGSKNLRVVACFEAVLTRAMERIFNIPLLTETFNKIYACVKRSMQSGIVYSMPELYMNCAWSKFNFMQFAMRNTHLFHDQVNNDLINDLHNLMTLIKPLSIILETISEESFPLCTLVRPLTLKLYEHHFAIYTLENELLLNVKKIIDEELSKDILSAPFLNEACLFDMRFQQDFVSNRAELTDTICTRFDQLIEATKVDPRDKKNEQSDDQHFSCRKSGLKSFFSRISIESANNGGSIKMQQPEQQKTGIYLEFERYKHEPNLDLDQCPINWWRESGERYRQLSKIADYYLCVPCCVNNVFRYYNANERMAWLNKRFVLRQKNAAEKSLWYLHYNKVYYSKIQMGQSIPARACL